MFDIESNPNLFRKLQWQSDWNPKDLGYEGEFVISLYTYHKLNFYKKRDRKYGKTI